MDQQESNQGIYARNRAKIRGVLIGITVLFIILIILVVLLYITNSPLLRLGGDLLLILTRIVFIILIAPTILIVLFVGHRKDDARNKTLLTPYPLWAELA